MQTAIRYQQCVTSYKYQGVPIIITFKNKKMTKNKPRKQTYKNGSTQFLSKVVIIMVHER